MINTNAILKNEFQKAKAGPANANLLSRIGQSRTRVPVPQPSYNPNQNNRMNNKKGHKHHHNNNNNNNNNNNAPNPTGSLPKLPPPNVGKWVPKKVDPERIKGINELRGICEESPLCREKPMFLMGLIFAAIGPKRKLSRRQRALEQIMNKP